MRKLISALLILSMLVCMIPGMALTTSAEGAKIEPDTSWYIGHESETEYHLYDAADLLGFASLIATAGGTYNDVFASKTVYIENDIDINPGWTVGDEAPSNVWPEMVRSRDFSGTIDGKGHTISGIYQVNGVSGDGLYAGIFANVKGGTAEIKNLVVVNSYSETKASDAQGFLFGATTTSAIVKLTDVYVDATLVNTDKSGDVSGNGIGGLIGGTVYDKAGGQIIMTNCVFAGSIDVNLTSGTTYIGGLLGRYNTKWTTFTNCASYATIKGSVTGTTNLLVGGIVGDNIGQNRLTFKNCISAPTFNNIKNDGGNLYFGEFVGGSRYSGTSYSPFTFSDVIYTGSNALLGCVYAKGTTTFETSGTAYDASVKNEKSTKTDNLTTAVSAWTNWDTSTGKPLPKTVAEMLIDPVTEVAGYQATDATGDKFSFRIVAVIDLKDGESLADYEEVGFKVSATYAGLSTPMTKDYSTTTVYTSVTGDTATGLVEYTAEDLGGDYIFALACKNVPANVGEITVTVTSYYKKVGGSVVDGATQTLIVSVPKDAVN